MFEELLVSPEGVEKRIVAGSQEDLDEAVALYKKELGIVDKPAAKPSSK